MAERLSELLDRWRTGDQAAAAQIYARFEEQLRLVALRRIGPSLRAKLQPDSVVLFVAHKILEGVRNDRYHIDGSSRFFDLAARIADRRILKEIEYWKQQKRDLRRTVRDDGATLQSLVERDCASESAAVADFLQELRDALPPERFEVFQLHYEGYTKKEIAERVGRERHTIARWLKEIAAGLQAPAAAARADAHDGENHSE